MKLPYPSRDLIHDDAPIKGAEDKQLVAESYQTALDALFLAWLGGVILKLNTKIFASAIFVRTYLLEQAALQRQQ